MDAKEIAESLCSIKHGKLYATGTDIRHLSKAYLALLAKWEALDEPTNKMIAAARDTINEYVAEVGPLETNPNIAMAIGYKAMIAEAKETK